MSGVAQLHLSDTKSRYATFPDRPQRDEPDEYRLFMYVPTKEKASESRHGQAPEEALVRRLPPKLGYDDLSEREEMAS